LNIFPSFFKILNTSCTKKILKTCFQQNRYVFDVVVTSWASFVFCISWNFSRDISTVFEEIKHLRSRALENILKKKYFGWSGVYFIFMLYSCYVPTYHRFFTATIPSQTSKRHLSACNIWTFSRRFYHTFDVKTCFQQNRYVFDVVVTSWASLVFCISWNFARDISTVFEDTIIYRNKLFTDEFHYLVAE
jgi:4-hydroxybenzoate polyprenyltransferase